MSYTARVRFDLLRVSLIVAGALALAGCVAPPKEAPAPVQSAELVLVATTDFHAALDRAEGLASVLSDLRKRHGDHLVYVDAGDQYQGTLDGRVGKGEAVVTLFNLVGLDVAAVGNHELSYGPLDPGRIAPVDGEDALGNFRARAHQARYPWLSANWVWTEDHAEPARRNAAGRATVATPRAVVERGGLRACFIGVTTPQTSGRTLPEYVRGTAFEPLAATVSAEASWLRAHERCDFVVLVAHAGLLCKPGGAVGDCLEHGRDAEILTMLEALPEGTLSAVVAGHTHLAAQVVIRGTPVIEAGADGKLVGVLHLFAGGRQPAVFEPFRAVPAQASAPEVTRALAPHRERLAALKARVVGELGGPLPRDLRAESAFGNLVADALLRAGQRSDHATIAVVHAGHIRDGLAAGTVRYGDVFRTLPFDNSLVVVELSGAELLQMLGAAMSGAYGVASVSGLDVTLEASADASGGARYRVKEVRDGQGNAIAADRLYRVATADYLVRGGDEQKGLFDTVSAARIHPHPDLLTRDLLVELLGTATRIEPARLLTPRRTRVFAAPPRPALPPTLPTDRSLPR